METVWSKAAERIERFGWGQGREGNSEIGYCAVGSLRVTVLNDAYVLLDHAAQLVSHLGLDSPCALHEGCYGYAVACWNDQPERTREEVLGVFREMHQKELAEKGAM